MPTIPKFDPPALLDDFDDVPGHLDTWSEFISGSFESAIARVKGQIQLGDESQYYNEMKTPTDPEHTDKDVVWDGFPKVLTIKFSRKVALAMADELEPVGGSGFVGRIQDEYCEWRVETHPQNDDVIVRVIFTCEGPEYWSSLAGGQQIFGTFGGAGDKTALLGLYKSVLGDSANVQMEDLFFPANFGNFAGLYNPYNKWNSTDGIVHLHQGANNLSAEINIGADATVLRRKGGATVTDATRLNCCGGFGVINRSSDPTMGDEINFLARAGYAITLRNPVGIYFNSFDNSGISKPGPDNGHVPAGNYWKPLRGQFDPTAADPGDMRAKDNMVVRAVYEVTEGELGPDGKQLTVSDLKIGGEKIEKGGQLAEKIKMKFIGRVTRKNSITNAPVPCSSKCCHDVLPNGRKILEVRGLNAPCQDVFPISMPPAPAPEDFEIFERIMAGSTRVD